MKNKNLNQMIKESYDKKLSEGEVKMAKNNLIVFFNILKKVDDRNKRTQRNKKIGQ